MFKSPLVSGYDIYTDGVRLLPIGEELLLKSPMIWVDRERVFLLCDCDAEHFILRVSRYMFTKAVLDESRLN